jgi:two-component system sensor histidine kinase KdpD
VDVSAAEEQQMPERMPRYRHLAAVGPRRLAAGFVIGIVLLAALTGFLVHHRADISVATSLALYLLVVVSVTAIGGPLPGVTAAVAAPLLANWYLIPPYHTLRINNTDNLIELSVFVSTATIVSAYVSIAERRAIEADEARRTTQKMAVEQNRLRKIALEAEMLAKADELRTAILRAVSHDLRTPLAAIKASVSSLRQEDVQWDDVDRGDFLQSIEGETDRLTNIVTNLLDLSRIEAGVVRPSMYATSVDDVISTTLRSLAGNSADVTVDVPADLPEVMADHALFERALVNLVQNSAKWSPAGTAVLVRGRSVGASVEVSVIDHGPGIPVDKRLQVLQPFHRLSDATSGGGLGLGLAIADRLIASMNGHLELHETDGGGLTAVITLPSVVGDAP